MGADRGVLVKTDGIVEPLAVAKILKGAVEAEQRGLVIMGKQAIDDDCNATGQMLAALLSPAPRFSRASLKIVKKFRFKSEVGTLAATGTVAGGIRDDPASRHHQARARP